MIQPRVLVFSLFLVGSAFASGACDKPAPTGTPAATSGSVQAKQAPGKALAVAPFKIVWDRPGQPAMTEEVGADGSVKMDGKEASKIEGSALKVHDKVELEVGADGSVTNGHGAAFGKFGDDDVLVLAHRTKRLRLLEDGHVVAEDADGSNRVQMHARVEPYTAAIRRAALLDVAFFAGLAPDLRDLLGTPK